MVERHLHTCMLCEAVCGLVVETEGDAVTKVHGDRDDPFSQGHICPKATALIDLHRDPNRITAPMRRQGDHWSQVSWQDALAESGRKLAEIQAKHGRDAVAFYFGNPTAHSYGAMMGVQLFAAMLGSRAMFSAASVDQLPQMIASYAMFGHQALIPVPDLDRTGYMLVLGANPIVSNGSIMTAGGVGRRLAAMRARGGKLVVVDPRRTETADVADEHLPIRPSADVFFLLAVAHVLVDEKLTKIERLPVQVSGLAAFTEHVARFPPERVQQITGIDAATIRRIARELANAESSVVYGRVGMCTQRYGGLASWLVVALNVLTGNLDRPGGAMFASPAADIVRIASWLGKRGRWGAWKSRVRGLDEFGGELPAATLAEEIETDGPGRIRALVTFAGNPVLSTPNGPRLARALGKLEHMVSIDVYRNETTRHADVIFPTSLGFERDHYDLVLYAFAVRDCARYVRGFLNPPEGTRSDFHALTDLGAAILAAGGGSRRRRAVLAAKVGRRLGPERLLDLLLRTGSRGLSIHALSERPHGIDLGALTPRLSHVLATHDRTIHLAPAAHLGDLARAERELDAHTNEAPGARADANAPLVLIGRRTLRSHNSWLHNVERLVRGKQDCTLLMHPDDARERGVVAGSDVRVTSATGEIVVPLEVTDAMRRGVVSLPHGWGHAREGVLLDVARRHAGASANDLTSELEVDPLSGNAAVSGVQVHVTPLAANAR